MLLNKYELVEQRLVDMSDEPDSEKRRRELIAEIVAAFEGVVREEGTTIHANFRSAR